MLPNFELETIVNVIQFVAKRTGRGKRYAKRLLDSGEIISNGTTVADGNQTVEKFDRISAAGQTLQAVTARYLMLHKPSGIVSATSDKEHRTVVDLIDETWAKELHLAGRLDRFTTGLVILTNNSKFSESLTRPWNKVSKTYSVETDRPITAEAIANFQVGMSFEKERVRTHPALVELLSEDKCKLTIFEGKHHQVKRMFLRFGIRVNGLHRLSIGPYGLPDDLVAGKWRDLTLLDN